MSRQPSPRALLSLCLLLAATAAPVSAQPAPAWPELGGAPAAGGKGPGMGRDYRRNLVERPQRDRTGTWSEDWPRAWRPSPPVSPWPAEPTPWWLGDPFKEAPPVTRGRPGRYGAGYPGYRGRGGDPYPGHRGYGNPPRRGPR